MSDTSPYERLGVTENSTFDEIQEVRNALLKDCVDDRRKQEEIEAAYDAILMERLRLRQEGRIKVPEGIRFPERVETPTKEVLPPETAKTPSWLQNLVDTPSQNDVLLSAVVFAGLGLLAVMIAEPSFPLALGVGFSLYFINRKDHNFGRSLLLTLLALIVGVVLGMQLGSLLAGHLGSIFPDRDGLNTFASLVTFVVLWVVSSFLR